MHNRRGFSLLELLVALLLFNVALLGMVATSAVAASELRAARLHATAARLAARRLEILASTPCDDVASGDAAHPDGVRESWQVGPRAGGVRPVRDSVDFVHRRGRSAVVVQGALRC